MTRKLFTTTTFALFLFSSILNINCKKEDHEKILSNTKENVLTIMEAKNWFNENSIIKQSNYVATRTDLRSKIKPFTPQWNNALNSEDANYEIVECPIQFETSPGFLLTNSSSLNNTINGLTRLLILKDKKTGIIQSALMNVYSFRGEVDENINYSRLPDKFSGNIFFTDLNGEFINGWIYDDGKVLLKSKKPDSNTDARIAPTPEGGTGCQTFQTYWYERTCYFYSDGSEQCTDWVFVGTTSTTYCPTSGSGGYDGTEPDCEITALKALNDLITSSIISSEIKSITTIENLTDTRTKKYEWIILKNIGWYLFSWEKGIHMKTTNTNPSLQWQWKSLEHQNISRVGIVVGGNVDYSLISAIPTLGQYNAIMDLDFGVKFSVVCKGFPFATDLVFNSNKSFNVND